VVKNEQLIVDFVNTAELDPQRESLGTPADLVRWVREHDLGPCARASEAELDEARHVREALREVLLAHNEVAVDLDAANRVLDAAARRAGLTLRFSECVAHLEPSGKGVQAALGRILIAVSDLMADGTWDRLKACRADDCRWAFYDSARNQSRAWCSMQSCGNRAKVHAFRSRRRT
jgi:predicted RNA-binding Zn ribbon-like protein